MLHGEETDPPLQMTIKSTYWTKRPRVMPIFQNRPLSLPNCYAVLDLTSITYCLCRAYSINAALSKKAYPTIIQFEVKFLLAKKMSYAQVLSQHALSGALDKNGLSARQKGNRFAKAGSKYWSMSNQRWANLTIEHKLIQD